MIHLICIICLIIGYFCGSFQTAFFIGKLKHVDLRKQGSGNLGTTNTFRVLGVKWGILTFVGDICKVWIAILLVYLVVIGAMNEPIDRIALITYTGLGTVLGHDFPFYLHWQGGKGVAATVAVLIAYLDWRLVVIGVIVFFAIVLITRYVSLGSMALVTVEYAAIIVFSQTGLLHIDPQWMIDVYVILAIMLILVFVKHKKNIIRLSNGQENKFSFHK